jgi:hypothetical protein
MLGALIGGLIGGWLIVQGLLQVQETWEKNKGPYILASEWMDGPDRVSKSEYKRVKYTQAGTLLFFGLVIWGFIAFAHEERKREAEKWERLEMPAVQRETKVETTIRHDPEDDSHIDLDQYDAHYHHILDTEFRTDEDFKRDLRAALERDKREPRNPDGSRRRPQLPPTPDELRYGPEAAKQRAEQAQPPPLPNGPRGQVQGGLE